MARKLSTSEKKVPIAARVDPAVLRGIEALGAADDRTLSYMVERCMREYLERHHAKPKLHKR